MTDNTSHQDKISIKLTKGEVVFVSLEDEPLTAYKWSAMIGRKGHVYAHRSENKKKIYLIRSIMERMLGRALVPGETCYHINGDSRDKTRPNLGLKVSKKLQKERDNQQDT